MRSSTTKRPEHGCSLEREIRDLKKGAAALSIDFTGVQLKRFTKYVRILHSMQDRIHLISRQDYTRIARRHLLPSLMVRPYATGTRLCDIGSGAGFPGIPLAIMDDSLRLSLFESTGKKADFLENLAHTLELDSIEVIHGRAEQYGDALYDTIVLRAVGTIKKNVKIIDRLLAPGGRGIFFKTDRFEPELAQARLLMEKLGFCAEVHRLYTPIEQRPLALVVLQRDTAERCLAMR